MLIAFTTFLVVLGIVLGAYWLFVVRLEETSDRNLRRRLRVDRPKRDVTPDLFQPTQPLSQVSSLDRVLRRTGFFVAPINRRIHHAGLNTTVGVIFLSSVLAALVVGASLYFLTRLVSVAVVVGAVASYAPFLFVRIKGAKRQRQFEEQFPEALDLIARALRAGHALTTGLGMVADEMKDPVGGEFRLIHDRQNYGMPLPDALRDFAERVPLLDARFFVTAVLTQREAGGNLAEVLDNLAALIRERFKVKRQVRTVSAHGRITGWVLSFLAPTLAAVLVVIAPSHMSLMIEDPLGVQMIIGAMALQIIGVIAIRRIINIEV